MDKVKILDAVYLLLVVFMAVRGYKDGLISQAISFIGLIVAYFTFVPAGNYVASTMRRQYPIVTDHMMFVYLLVIIVIYAFFTLLGHILTFFFQQGGREIDIPIRIAGGAVGIVKGIVLCIFITHFMVNYLIPREHLMLYSTVGAYFAGINESYVPNSYIKLYHKLNEQTSQ